LNGIWIFIYTLDNSVRYDVLQVTNLKIYIDKYHCCWSKRSQTDLPTTRLGRAWSMGYLAKYFGAINEELASRNNLATLYESGGMW